jgi:dipeptidyl aminopeptidase/acylaminoacyl peptidase
MDEMTQKPRTRSQLSDAAWAFTLIVIAAVSHASTDESRTLPEVYGRLPTLEDVVLSPDGSKLAYVKTFGDRRELMIVRVVQPLALGGAHVGDTKLRGIRWMDDDNLLITISSTGLPPLGFTGAVQEWYQLATYDVANRKLAGLAFDVPDERTFNVVIGTPSVRNVGGMTILFVPGLYVAPEQTLPGLFKYSVADRRMKLIAKGYEPWTDWLVDDSGRIAVQFTYHDQKKQWELKSRKDDRLTLVANGDAAIDVPSVLGFSSSGDSILVRFIEDGDPVWKPLMLKDGSWGTPLEQGAAFEEPIKDRKTGRIIGGVRDIDDSHYVLFDTELQAHWDAILRAFPGEHVDLVSHSDDFTKVVVRVFGARDGFVYALFDWYTHRSAILGRIYQDVVPAEVRRVSYRAADGLTIPGYLTLPRRAAEKNLPLIVMPHGGPAASDSLAFDWWAQAFAAEGYAVLQPNYRGSDLSHRFMAAGFGEWGRKMQTDLSDGVRYLAQQGIIDPKRVCIVGASYGGYAALAGATMDVGVYRCAISVAGISDLKRFLKWTDNNFSHNDNYVQRYWDRFMGASGRNDPALRAISPIEHVSAVSAPVLLIHGRDDTVVPYEQSDVMADALKHAGKSVELVTLKHEDHWLSRSATRLQMLEASVAFLKKNNPAD